jgi:hypothetical protein
MAQPIRIQLSRARRWRIPANTVKVDRTTKWGNPFDVAEYGHELALRLFEETASGSWCPAHVADIDEPTVHMLHEAHRRWLRRIGGNPVEAARTELRGKDLACWCKEGDTCHAEILLRIANAD